MPTFSKFNLLALRQCPKRFWLELYQPGLRLGSATQSSFTVGHQVGDIARRLYDPEGKGALIDPESEGVLGALARSRLLLKGRQPIFKASFRAAGVTAFVDVMLPVKMGGKAAWRIVQVNSSTSVKDYHRDDAAILICVARAAGVPLAGIALAHIDSQWIYPGSDDYRGLLCENDLTAEALCRTHDVEAWVAEAQIVASKPAEPDVRTGAQCFSPYECGFFSYCSRREPQVQQPVSWLPYVQAKDLKALIESKPALELRDVPDGLVNELQLQVKTATLSGKPYLDAGGAAQALRSHKLPAYFMNLESVQFAVPIWKGTRPYQQIPFQFSVHVLSSENRISHQQFLDLSGNDPSKEFALALIAACGEQGPIFIYNDGLVKSRFRELADRFPLMAKPLMAMSERVVDLLPVAREHFYDPCQQSSWSIKAKLHAACPELSLDALDVVQDGGMAMNACLEALGSQTAASRKQEIERQLLSYSALDTLVMVRLWSLFSGETLKG